MDDTIQESAYLLSIAYLLLGLIFIFLALYSIPCLWKAWKCRQFFPKIFYLSILAICCDQAAYQLLYLYEVITAIKKEKDDKSQTESFRIIFFQTIYVPDAIFFVIYFSLFWQFLIMMHHGRIRTGSIQVGKRNWNPEQANSKVRLILYLYIIGQAIVIWQFMAQELSPKAIMICDIAVNASVPIIVVIMVLYLNIKFSGSPFVSNKYEKSNNKIQQLLWIWILLRIPQLGVNVLVVIYNDDLIALMGGKLEVTFIEQLLLILFIVGDIIIVQIIPVLMAMSNSFLSALLLDHNKINQFISVEAFQGEMNLQQQTQGGTIPLKNNPRDYSLFIDLKLSDLEINEKQFYKKYNGFGEIKTSTIKSNTKKYAIRVIQFKELSSFLIDETKQEIQQINNIKKGYKILWFNFSESSMYLLSKFYPNSNLNNFIHKNTDIGSAQIKDITTSYTNKQLLIRVNIATDLIKAIQNLHDQNVIHGHLNSNNILFTDKFKIKIVDYGLRAIKKYASLVNGYCNKNGFTAPECLNDRGNVVSHSAIKESDIYSFGMILYQLFTETIPFYNMPQKDIVQLVKEQQSRPKIPESLNTNIATLIRCCWQQDPLKRPNINQILITLKQISENLE
ncbi:unnamed protein product [Paramecium pentaurelia]|uniref:Protein kinase domain-containing protein n=1 Tax=Paramecium pentaurelia TaxID=43138 RepID=A0A8S1WJE0_9CILI|nr:unnamed protein product [Paramecium pentaurelia]